MSAKNWFLVILYILAIIEMEEQRRWIIATNSGLLEGVRKFSLVSPFYAFKGVPYAEPPVGNLRFKNPVPKAAWEGVLDASHHRGSCEVTENCLYVNVYTPSLFGQVSVMVCILTKTTFLSASSQLLLIRFGFTVEVSFKEVEMISFTELIY